MSYADQARLLKTVLRNEPAAVFIDLLYTQKRTRELKNLGYYSTVLAQKNKSSQVPVYVAALPEDFNQPVIPEISNNSRSSIVGWEGMGDQYPLIHEASSGEVNETPALALYRHYCNVNPEEKHCSIFANQQAFPKGFDNPMIVAWGSVTDEKMKDISNTADCKVVESGLWSRIKALLRLLFHGVIRYQYDALEYESVTRQACPYSRVIPAEYLLARKGKQDRESLRTFIKGKTVLIGASLTGMEDEVESPVHGKTPGVLLHAMALDNLITRGGGYLKKMKDIDLSMKWLPLPMISLGSVVTLVIYLACIFYIFCIQEKLGSPAMTDEEKEKLQCEKNIVNIKCVMIDSRVVIWSLLGVGGMTLGSILILTQFAGYLPFNWIELLGLVSLSWLYLPGREK